LEVARRANRRRALGLTVLPAALVAIVFVVLGLVGLVLVVAIVIAVVVLAAGVGAFLAAPRALRGRLTGLGTVEADPAVEARLYNVAEGLCLAWGLPQPELHLLADDAANAISVGRSPDDAVVICTTGLVEKLDRMELEAVLAHELAHVRNLDILSGSVAAGTVGYLALSSAAARRALVRLSGAGRESLADQASTMVTRYPPAMASALEKLAAAPVRRPAALSRSLGVRTSHMWLVPLDASASFSAPAGREPLPGALSVEERVQLLGEL
jgi:heat shock protein HtpX